MRQLDDDPPLRARSGNRLDAEGPADLDPGALGWGLLDMLDFGVLACDAGLRVRARNRAAQHQLTGSDILRLGDDDRLQSTLDLQPLRAAVQQALQRGRHSLVCLERRPLPMMLAVRPLPRQVTEVPCAIVWLGLSKGFSSLALRQLAGLHDLTGAELEVMESLLQGVDVAGLAHRRGVAISTVRTQIASLRMKFGVRRTDELIRIASRLPPVACRVG